MDYELLQNGTRVRIERDNRDSMFGFVHGFGFFSDNNTTGIRYFVRLDFEYQGYMENGLFVSVIVAHPDSLHLI